MEIQSPAVAPQGLKSKIDPENRFNDLKTIDVDYHLAKNYRE